MSNPRCLLFVVLTLAYLPGQTAALEPQAAGQTLTVDSLVGNSPLAIGANDTWDKIFSGSVSAGTINHSAGTINVTTEVTVGANNAGDGVYNLTGGALTTAKITLGRNSFANGFFARGTVNQSAGTFTTTGETNLGYGGIGIYNLNGGTFDGSAVLVWIGRLAGSTGVFHLNGGTMRARRVLGDAGSSTFHFNGGTLQAGATDTEFFHGLETADVRNGGAKIDTAGLNVTAAQVLEHSTVAGDAAVDGGLTKSGGGTLTLTAVNTYTGRTTVSGGTLAIPSGSVGVAAAPARIVVNGTGSTLTLSGTGVLRGELLYVGNSGSGTANQSAGTLTLSGLQLGAIAGGSGVFNLSGGTFTSTGIAYVGNAGTGTFNLSNGTLTAHGLAVGASGTGTLTQTGGTLQLTGDNLYGNVALAAGSVGAINLSAGTFRSKGLILGDSGSGTFTQTGGTVFNTITLIVGNNAGSTGIYQLNGGILETANVLGGAGTANFNFNGGTLRASVSDTAFFQALDAANVRNGGARIDTNGFNVTAAQVLRHSTVAGDAAIDGGLTKSGAGTLTLTAVNTYTGRTTVSAGTLAIPSGSVGVTGSTERFDVNGALASPATANVSGTGSIRAVKVWVGPSGSGILNQSGGTMTPLEILLSVNPGSTGTLNQSGGTITTPTLYIGYLGTGVFNLSSGTLNVTGDAYVGTDGTGTLTQTGGTFVSTLPVYLTNTASGTGTYHLNGGVLRAPGVNTGGGASTFNLNGGTLQAAASGTAFFQGLTTANVRNSGAKLDTNGFDVTAAQALRHSIVAGDAAIDGGLTKSGAGVLTLSGANTYTGPTLLNAGTTRVAATGTLGSGGGITNAAASTLDVTPFGGGGFPLASGRTLTNNGTITGTVQVSGLLQGYGGLGGLVVNAGGVVANSGTGTAVLTGAVVNHGTIRFAGGAVLNAGGATSFVNNGILDLITAGPGTTLPANLTGTGLVLTASSVKVKDVSRAGSVATVSIDSYDGHVYSLQRSTDLAAGFTTVAAVAAQSGVTGTTLTFTDNAAPVGNVFYRVMLNP